MMAKEGDVPGTVLYRLYWGQWQALYSLIPRQLPCCMRRACMYTIWTCVMFYLEPT